MIKKISNNLIVADDSSFIRRVLEEREFETNILSKYPSIESDGEDQIYMMDMPLDDNALRGLMSLTGINAPVSFIKETLINHETHEDMDKIIGKYFCRRLKEKSVIVRAVDDIFSNGMEIRHICSDSYAPISDMSILEMTDSLNNLQFFESSLGKYSTSLRLLSEDRISVEGRDILLGLGFSNSDFGCKSLGMGIYEADMRCRNQFVSSKATFSESIVHRIKDPLKLHSRFYEKVKALDNKLIDYGERIKFSNEKKLRISDIEEILDPKAKIHSKIKAIPEKHKDKMIKAFYEENLDLTNFGLKSSITRIMRDNRELEEHVLLNQAIEVLI